LGRRHAQQPPRTPETVPANLPPFGLRASDFSNTRLAANRPNPGLFGFKIEWDDPVTVHTGKHFLQIPGPTNVPDRVLRAMDMPTIDHRGPEFARLGLEVLEGCKAVFRTKNPVVIYPSSGTGAWEAAIVNTLSPGDKVLMVETGHFATLWKGLAENFKLDVEFLPGDWRRGAQPEEIGSRLADDRQHRIKR
jgi:alanine-glyoxylate transaminase / serine-glyoxylate transaminase / serine-pyruvate transaminase